MPRTIFQESGFNVDVLGKERIKSATKRWCSAFKNKGISGLQDTRKGNSGRPREKELTLEEKYERLMAQNKLLRAENELLKKLDMLERRMIKKR